ncbi:glycosyltransferase family 2 protein [candidate division KSB1 bacterium]|nr:glycosyltransferase family 2 protein [candidate division KSB1 bacterium]
MDSKCTLSGFTFVRNAIKYDYPIVEAVTSILPVCDEFIINVGNSDDGTLELIKSINSDKIKIVESVWDENLRTGGRILAQQTDIALQHCTGDWCFYIQGDEVVHEKFLPVISVSLNNYNTDQRVEGLLFKYLHFYGSYKYIGTSRRWYRQEIRIIRNKKGIKSYKDAQGFRINDKKLHVKLIDAYIYHYGWVKSPEMQQKKQRYFNRLWHSESWVENNVSADSKFDYNEIDELSLFNDSHPEIMLDRVAKQDWDFDYNAENKKKNIRYKHRILNKIENLTGYRIGEYKNFKLI